MTDVAARLKAARTRAGLSQRALADLSGIRQPNISAFEAGRVEPTADTLRRLLDACATRPGPVLRRHRDAVIDLIHTAGGRSPMVFGSVARGEDTPESDVDLLVDFDERASIWAIAELGAKLESLLGTHVDIVDDDGSSAALERARAEALPL